MLPAGEIGEIAVRAAHATRTYFNLPAATALAKIQDAADGGFYHRMGDAGYFDAEGHLVSESYKQTADHFLAVLLDWLVRGCSPPR